jgi:acetate kinase
MGTTLVVNPGSSSKKYALYKDGQPVSSWRYERGIGTQLCVQTGGSAAVCEPLTEAAFATATEDVLAAADEILKNDAVPTKLDTAVIRVVAPGTEFQTHQKITGVFVRLLRAQETVAPLHIPSVTKEIDSLQSIRPELPLFAASDSAFHATMSDHTRLYSIDASIAKEHDIYRFGYHGLSVASIVRRVHSVTGVDPKRMIVAHIGSGCSVTAVKDGQSVDTTMGFAPGSGLLMGSRGGDIDAGALLELMRVLHLTPTEAQMYLQTQTGLLALFGESDLRSLLDGYANDDRNAKAALYRFTLGIQHAIARSVITLGGCEMIVLTATAMERSPTLRELVVSGLSPLGVAINPDRNDALIGKEGVISTRGSECKVVVMRTDEMGEMYHVGQRLRASAG